jgi:hypothetical protein
MLDGNYAASDLAAAGRCRSIHAARKMGVDSLGMARLNLPTPDTRFSLCNMRQID